MRRLLAGFVVIAVLGVIGVAVATRNSSAAGPRTAHSGVARVAVTPRLKRLLGTEITTLRKAQPRAVAPARTVPPADTGTSCFVAGGPRCSEIPCRYFASAPAVLKSSSTETIVVPGGPRRKATVGHGACTRHAPRKLVLVSGP